MHDVTQVLKRIEAGDGRAAADLLPLVYQELRRLAAQKLRQESAGQTLQATALVHEVYLRIVSGDAESPRQWDSRGHFYSAAATAMQRILVEGARRKQALKRGGDLVRSDIDLEESADKQPENDLIALDEALEKLSNHDPEAAELVKLRYFAGLSMPNAARTLGLAPRSATRLWAYARAWLLRELRAE
ncbi:MAG: ECF-type sigma factor [Planctomycetota bacterium]